MDFRVYFSGIFLFISLSVVDVLCSVGCIGQNGQPVDWFAVYKLPKLDNSDNSWVKQGTGYLYLDVNSPAWSLSLYSINDTQSAPGRTLDQIYSRYKSEDFAYAFYNDETPPKKVSQSHGHTKGDIGFDKTGGFWLVHSVPRYPPYPEVGYSYPPTGIYYGQTYLCISLAYKYFDAIGEQFQYNRPQVYNYSLPEGLASDNPKLSAALGGQFVKQPPYNHSTVLESRRGQKFTSFAKYSKFEKDLYAAWVAPFFRTDLLVETWRYDLKMDCSATYKVFNIKDLNPDNFQFKESDDHSKWAVSTSGNHLCIGDINRAKSQERRGGGTVCFEHKEAWSAFYDVINNREHC